MSFWQAKTKIRPEDKIFSEYIRERDGWRCRYKFRCTGGEDFSNNRGGLTCSHFYKRRHESVRFDPDNCDAACRKCHMWVDGEDPNARKYLEQWKKQQLGEKRFNLLAIRKESYKKKDPRLDLLFVKELLKQLKYGPPTGPMQAL